MRGRQLCPAGGQLRRKVSELRLQVQAQLLDSVLQPVVGGNLFCLAYLTIFRLGRITPVRICVRESKGSLMSRF
jgi:hypothetical protein